MCIKWVKSIPRLIFGVNKGFPENPTPVDVFVRSIHIAAKCRFNASTRLKNKSEFSFATATILSLGLIFLPLVQVANIELYIKDELLTVIQIFLAVSVLVYSVINSKSRYDLRAVKINESGDKIKELAREVESFIATQPDKSKIDYEKYRKKYREIEIEIENHTQLDFDMAKLNMPRYYEITGFKRLYIFSICGFKYCFSYSVPALILLFEFGVIFTSIGIIPLGASYL